MLVFPFLIGGLLPQAIFQPAVFRFSISKAEDPVEQDHFFCGKLPAWLSMRQKSTVRKATVVCRQISEHV